MVYLLPQKTCQPLSRQMGLYFFITVQKNDLHKRAQDYHMFLFNNTSLQALILLLLD